jgi:hypothetical protein
MGMAMNNQPHSVGNKGLHQSIVKEQRTPGLDRVPMCQSNAKTIVSLNKGQGNQLGMGIAVAPNRFDRRKLPQFVQMPRIFVIPCVENQFHIREVMKHMGVKR